jgi:Fe-S cluster assembly scaffold protein SufB
VPGASKHTSREVLSQITNSQKQNSGFAIPGYSSADVLLMQHREHLLKHAQKQVQKQAQKQHVAASKLAQVDEEEDADEFGDGLEEKSYSVISTADLESLGLRKHPDAIAECASLNSVQAPKAAYKSRLPAHVLTSKFTAVFLPSNAAKLRIIFTF